MSDDHPGTETVAPDAHQGVVRSKTVTWEDPMVTAGMATSLSGLEFLAAIRDGRFPPPPIAQLMGFSLVELDVGLRRLRVHPR